MLQELSSGSPSRDSRSFQVSDGKIAEDDDGNPMIADMFDDPAFSLARREAVRNGLMLRRMGEFEPARLGPEEMEYTTIQTVLEKLKERFKPAV